MTPLPDRYLDLSPHFNENNFRVGFSLKGFSTDKTNDRAQFAKELGLDPKKLVIPKQVHGSHVHVCEISGKLDSTDGVISMDPSIVLSIQVADCIPLIFLDRHRKEFGLIHAGWRGTAKGIVTEAMNKTSGKIDNMFFVIGPSIRQCCFEVGPEVAKIFPEKYLVNGKGDRSYLDLQGAVIHQLIEQGVDTEKIIDLEECSHCNPDNYHSYRRDGKKAGRMIAMAGWL